MRVKVLLLVISAGFASGTAGAARPALPFPDNADPRQCGIPTRLGDRYHGTLQGRYHEQLFEPLVRLYDSHSRTRVVATVKSGTPAYGVLLVTGRQLNYLLVKVTRDGRTVEGWVPQPYFRLDPP